MLFRMTESQYDPDPVLTRALDILFILHADHEQNCSTAAMRAIGSSEVDPYSAYAGAAAALYGPLHGGANEAVLRMLESIGHVSNVPSFIERVKNRETLLFRFRSPRLQELRPRAKIIKRTADQVFEVTGRNPLLEIALELEKIALNDEFFIKRKLYPNVDFYSGLIYQSMGLPVSMFPSSSPSRGRPAGSRSGRRCSKTPSRKSLDPSRSLPARSAAIIRRKRADQFGNTVGGVSDAAFFCVRSASISSPSTVSKRTPYRYIVVDRRCISICCSSVWLQITASISVFPSRGSRKRRSSRSPWSGSSDMIRAPPGDRSRVQHFFSSITSSRQIAT